MRRVFLSLVLVTISSLSAADPVDPKVPPAPPEGWKEFSPKDKSFSVWLPDKGGKRTERERNVVIRRTRIRVNVVAIESNDGPTYTASTYIFPPTFLRRTPMQEKIEIIRDAYVKEVTGKITAEKEIKLGVVPGREYTIKTGQGMCQLRVFTAGSRMYLAVVTGTEKEIASKDAKTFLESYKLHKLLQGVPGDPAAAKGPTKAPPGAVKVFPGDAYAFIEQAIKDKRVADVDIQGFQLTKNTYRDVPPEGGILIGLQVNVGKFLNNATIDGIRPIYLTKKGEKLGEWQGVKSDDPVILKAKAGYVVAGMSVRSGLNLDGIALTYMKLDKGKLVEKDVYKSHQVGHTVGDTSLIGGQGIFFIGVTGHLGGEKKPCSIGLITVISPEG